MFIKIPENLNAGVENALHIALTTLISTAYVSTAYQIFILSAISYENRFVYNANFNFG